MNGRRALFYVIGFAGLAAVTAVVAGRVADPSIAPLLLADGGTRDARRRARTGAPARLAARPPPAAARRLPPHAGAGAAAAAGERRPGSPRLLRGPAERRRHRLRVRRVPARRLVAGRIAPAAVAGRLRRGRGRGVPRPEPAPAAPRHRHAPRPRRLRLHDRHVGARSLGRHRLRPLRRLDALPVALARAAAPARHRRARRRGDRRARGAPRAVHHRHDGGGGGPSAARLAHVGHHGPADGQVPLRPHAELPQTARPRQRRRGHARALAPRVLLAGERPRATSPGRPGAAVCRTAASCGLRRAAETGSTRPRGSVPRRREGT